MDKIENIKEEICLLISNQIQELIDIGHIVVWVCVGILVTLIAKWIYNRL